MYAAQPTIKVIKTGIRLREQITCIQHCLFKKRRLNFFNLRITFGL